MSEKPDLATTKASEPSHCPFCGGESVRFVNTWRAYSEEPGDQSNVAHLDEYQCHGACEGRSFWA